jgi:hypothetical protein
MFNSLSSSLGLRYGCVVVPTNVIVQTIIQFNDTLLNPSQDRRVLVMLLAIVLIQAV